MGYDAKVTAKGQVTLPVRLRERLALEPGDHIEFVEVEGGDFAIRKKDASFDDLRGIIKLDRPVDDEQIEAWIKQARIALGTRS